MPTCSAIVEKTKLPCKNKAKFGPLCGVHENSRLSRQSKAISLAKEQSSSANMTVAQIRTKKNVEKLDKTIKEIHAKKVKEFKRGLENPRFRSA
jgi:hypothetical protein